MSTVTAPEWVNQQLFSDLLKQNYADFETIQKFECTSAISGGENYLTIVLRISIEMRLRDDSSKAESYILKIPLVNDCGDEHDFHDLFIAEADMYERLVPELEQLYAKHTELSVRFKPAHLKFIENPPNCDYILMEDLRSQGYINLERMIGLGQTEIKAVLKKLAQWHAASAQRVVELGDYEETYQKSYMSEECLKWIEQSNITFNVPFLECMQQYYELEPGQQQLITNYTDRLTDLYLDFGRVNKSEFNVLNHGDFWCNNFLFQLNAGEIKDICFVDFQLPKYGTPAHDLFCLLMTTPNIHIKLEKFDDFIEYYHEELIAHLKLFKYANRMPTLTELHENLRRHSLWAFVCAQRMLPVTLFPPSPDSNVTNFMGDSEKALDFKRKMFTNPSFVKQIKLILPWLIQRGYVN
ncbi:uncharacterized protein LOC108648963 isoform X2 [Drosophila navojoa]|uniref:uncharacterized protein LOC108648963 isoform X2 n=1 Tax=Drosophila navojoa TaxID=7232 RepID=UPI0008466195|nr:uncharacterized protein LOC108648963 isoform X2 [Drosophila navojoa]